MTALHSAYSYLPEDPTLEVLGTMSLTHEILGGGGGVLFVLRQSDFVVQANLKLTAVLLPEKSWGHIPMSVCLANTYIFEVYFIARPKQYLLITFNKLEVNSHVKQLPTLKSISLRE